MAGSIKGIIVEIGGDTSGLQKALRKVNSETSSLSKELKGINRLLKLDPKNTELLNQKQTVLKESIEATKNKIKELKNVYNESVKAEANGAKISEENWRALRKEIEKNEIELRRLQVQASNFTKIGNFFTKVGSNIENFGSNIIGVNEKLSNLNSKISTLGSTLTTKVTLPVTALGASTVTTAISFLKLKENTKIAFQVLLGSAEKAQKMLDDLYTFAKTTPFSYDTYLTAGKNLTAMGVAAENVIPYLEKMTNAAIATGAGQEGINTLTEAIGRMSSKGKIQLEELNRIIELGVPAVKILGNAYGKTEEKIYDMMSGGELLAKDALPKLLEGMNNGTNGVNGMTAAYGGLASEMKGTLSGALDSLHSKFRNMSLQIWDAENAYPELTNVIKDFTNSLDVVPKIFKSVSIVATPALKSLSSKLKKLNDYLSKADPKQLEKVGKAILGLAAAGPALSSTSKLLNVVTKLGTGLGTLVKGTGTAVKGIGTFSNAIAVALNHTTSTNEKVNKLAGTLTKLTSPASLASAAVVASIAGISYAVKKSQEDVNKAYENMGKGISNFKDGVNNATSHLDSFNSTLFASNEEQQKLQSNMDEVQKGITDICKRASDERRDYTQEEIKQLDEYFEKLRKLKDRELEIQQSVSNAIVQQATQNAESFQGSLDEYKVQSQEWLKTAQEQKDKEIAIINDRTTQEIALLQQRYGDKANLENEEYAREYNAIIQDKDNAIAQANEKVAKVNEAYANGYAQRSEQEDSFFAKLKETNSNVENENTRHTSELDKINSSWYATEDMRRGAIEGENARHTQELKNQWKDLYKTMSDSEEEQMGTWIAMLADTELYGGQIDNESKKIVDNVIASYDNMPNGTRKAMKNAMQPMLEEMEKSEPSLFAKATSIANGILGNLRHAFDIHSPSKKTRKIFEYVMEGGEIELDAGAKRMYSQVDEMSKKLLNKFSGISTDINLGNINKKIIQGTQTVFTTPQIVFNVNELDEAKLQQCFNYINRKFGTCY